MGNYVSLIAIPRLIIALVLAAVTASAGDCLTTTLPIGEKDLLDPAARWTTVGPLPDSIGIPVLISTGYADSTGTKQPGLVTKLIDRCRYAYGAASDIELLIVFIGSKGDDKDENIYMVTMRGGDVIARTLIAQLQTTCSSTFLRGCRILNDGTIHVQQLEHTFDCDSDEFKGTNKLPAFLIAMRDDGTFDETLIETPPISDGD